MSKNASNKRRAKASHRDQWSRYPSTTPLAFVVHGIAPQSTPLMDIMLRHMDEAAAETRVKWGL